MAHSGHVLCDHEKYVQTDGRTHNRTKNQGADGRIDRTYKLLNILPMPKGWAYIVYLYVKVKH